MEQHRPSSPDPWGVRRAENLLTSLQDVLSARIEVSPTGEVMAVHILTSAGISSRWYAMSRVRCSHSSGSR